MREKTLRFARFFQGMYVMSLPRYNSRKDERSPPKSAPSRTGARRPLRLISNVSRRGAGQWKSLRTPGMISAWIVRDLSR